MVFQRCFCFVFIFCLSPSIEFLCLHTPSFLLFHSLNYWVAARPHYSLFIDGLLKAPEMFVNISHKPCTHEAFSPFWVGWAGQIWLGSLLQQRLDPSWSFSFLYLAATHPWGPPHLFLCKQRSWLVGCGWHSDHPNEPSHGFDHLLACLLFHFRSSFSPSWVQIFSFFPVWATLLAMLWLPLPWWPGTVSLMPLVSTSKLHSWCHLSMWRGPLVCDCP